jgi:Xaa-Pro aminopeptidase
MSGGAVRQGRIATLREAMRREGVQCFVMTSPVTLDYFFGFREEGGERLLAYFVHADGRERLVCPALSANQARRCGVCGMAEWRDGDDPWPLVARLVEEWKLGQATIAVDDDCRADVLLGLMAVAPECVFSPGQRLVGDSARVKDQTELGLLRHAASIADQALEPVLSRVRPGATEAEVASWLAQEMSDLGGRPAFAIVAAGPNAAEPHHQSDETVLSAGDVLLLDYGCEFQGYMSDVTRTVCLGPPSPKAAEVYEVVYQAFMAARDTIGPGVPASAVDQAARSRIEEAGYGPFFVHRTGHGLGMRVHEEPYIRQGNHEPLRIGEVFSVEPGIYLPGQFGVRIENIVTVTENGHRSLNGEPSPALRQAPWGG